MFRQREPIVPGYIPTSIEVKELHTRDIANWMITQLKEKQQKVVQVDKKEFYYYQRLLTGRRCTCWGPESSSRGDCPICWGTGVVVGFEKYGCWSYSFDVSSLNVGSVNIITSVDEETRPLTFLLEEGFDRGLLEFRVYPQKSDVSYLDAYQVIGNGCTVLIKAQGDSSWVSDSLLESKMDRTYIDFRVQMRVPRNGSIPYLQNIFLRKRIREDNYVFADIPRSDGSAQFVEQGSYSTWTSIQMYIANPTLRNITSQDFFKEVHGDGVWKPVSVNAHKPMSILVSYDINARSADPDEKYRKVY